MSNLFIFEAKLSIASEKSDRSIIHEYSALIESLQKNGIDVAVVLKENVSEYLKGRGGASLIKIQTFKEGLTWNFYDLVFLRKDLVFVSYDDGEMLGGELLLKIIYSKNKVVSMKALWDSGWF
jgi:hypothetical protein